MDEVFLGLRVLVSLGVIVGAIWFVRSKVTGRTGARAKTVALVGRQSLGAKNSVAIVDMDGKRFYLGVTEKSITVLHSAEAPAQAFAGHLDSAMDDGAESLVSTAIPSLVPRSDVLAGSIISLATWKRAIESIKQSTLRKRA